MFVRQFISGILSQTGPHCKCIASIWAFLAPRATPEFFSVAFYSPILYIYIDTPAALQDNAEPQWKQFRFKCVAQLFSPWKNHFNSWATVEPIFDVTKSRDIHCYSSKRLNWFRFFLWLNAVQQAAKLESFSNFFSNWHSWKKKSRCLKRVVLLQGS